MASRIQRLFTRAAVPRAGLGNLLVGPPNAKGSKGPSVATLNVSYNSPGQPQILDRDTQAFGEEAYLGQAYVMRCCQIIAQTISALPFRAGMNPTDPAAHDLSAPLVQLLGESSPQAPGGPNPVTASRAFWAWSIVQYIIYGRWAWEAELVGSGKNKLIVSLWPLVAANMNPIPSQSGQHYFDSYVYTTPQWGNLKLGRDQVIYAWRPSLTDWRVPETVISAAKLPIYIAKGMDKYMTKLLENDMVASTMVVTPPFEEPSARRAWQEQFNTTFSGIDNRGKTIFAEAEYDEDDNSTRPLVQIEKIAQTAVDAQLLEYKKDAVEGICMALGVPMSLVGTATQRIYSNMAAEYKNFWTMTVLSLIMEIQDHINTNLAPRMGEEVGWFDLSRVAALQPPAVFTPPMISDAINFGVASPEQIANMLGIPAADATSDSDIDTIELGEESSGVGATGQSRAAERYMHTRSPLFGPAQARNFAYQRRAIEKRAQAVRDWKGTRVTKHQLINARIRYEKRAINSYNWEQPFIAAEWLQRERIHVQTPEAIESNVELRSQDQPEASADTHNPEAEDLMSSVRRIQEHHHRRELERKTQVSQELAEQTVALAEGFRFLALGDRVTRNIHTTLLKGYPPETLGWVHDADWQGPGQVNLRDVNMSKRPKASKEKIAGLMKAMALGRPEAMAPVVLVKTPNSEKLQVAHGHNRLTAHEKLGHSQVSAYIGSVSEDEGPWTDMHTKQLKREQSWDILNPEAPPWRPPEDLPMYIHMENVYKEGVEDAEAGRDKQTPEEYVQRHLNAGPGDYRVYKSGYAADQPDFSAHFAGQARAWLPITGVAGGDEIIHCAYCGEPAVNYFVDDDLDGSKFGLCGVHTDVATGSDSVREPWPTPDPLGEAVHVNGIPLDVWLEANGEELLAMAEEEWEADMKKAGAT